MLRITRKKLIRYVLLPNLIVFTALAIYFPGSQLPKALTLARRSAMEMALLCIA